MKTIKSILLAALVLGISLPAIADFNGTGYYRVKNEKYGRYISAANDDGDFKTSIAMIGNQDSVIFDAGTIIHLEYIDTLGGYDLRTQGLSTAEMSRILFLQMFGVIQTVPVIINHISDDANGVPLYNASITVTDDSDPDYVTSVTAYFQDQGGQPGGFLTNDFDVAMTGNDPTTRWYITPIDAEDNYFTPAPDEEGNYVNDGTYNYATLYVDFPILLPADADAFAVTNAETNCVKMAAAGELVPANTHVLLRWKVGTTLKLNAVVPTEAIPAVTVPDGNQLYWCGTYFGKNCETPVDGYYELEVADGKVGFTKALTEWKNNTVYMQGATALVWPQEESGKPGDANEDGSVDVNDVTTVINYILGKNPTPFNYDNANVNSDEQVDVMDVTLIINIILNPNQ
ncbi:MAG: dockerin type I repeat-containing protein [Muribaculaceae bacterium]|nr:dockerin type I repeat-containing protein [Muribaculaceae bacterium]